MNCPDEPQLRLKLGFIKHANARRPGDSEIFLVAAAEVPF